MERFWLPIRASEHAADLDHLNALVHWLMLVLFIGWGAFFVYTIWRFHRSRSPRADYVGVRSHTSNYLEVAVAIIEVVLLVGFSIPLWAHRANESSFPDQKDAVIVKVIGEQFAWNVHYPGSDGKFGKQDVKLVSSDNPVGLDRNDSNGKDDIVKINDLTLPLGKPAIVYIGAKDVIHSFALQQMRVKQDAIPGQSIPVWFVPNKTTAQMQEEMARVVPVRNGQFGANHVAMEDYGGVIKKGGIVTDKKGLNGEDSVMDKLAAAGIKQIKVAPQTPTEVTCAQLCGLGHYRMRGYYTIVTQEAFDQWVKEQSEAAASDEGGYE
jgi:cytochrome c oxidase subunit 2